MEPATKRQKTAEALTSTDEDDELFLEPEELNQRRDPSYLLAKGRAKAATQLKSRFEDIFAKYERDFTGIGDEIDLATGEVVVDNGHLSSMRSMKDWIVDDDEDGDEDGNENGDDDENDEGEGGIEAEENTWVSPGEFADVRPDSANGCSGDPWRIAGPSWPAELASRKPPLLESLLSTQSHPANQSHFPPSSTPEPSVSADPTWQAPELPPSAFLSQTLGPNGRHYGGTIPVATRKVLRKSLNEPVSPEADNEDDLQIALSIAPERKETKEPLKAMESPLINRKFPGVDSSPRDSGLQDLIQDVIANIPDTPPSIRRSKLSKSLGRPSPLTQERRRHSKAESKLRFSSTLLDDDSTKLPKKRGRKPKVRAGPAIGELARVISSDQGGQSSWEESDLESFLDITGHGIPKPPGQTLYVDIRTRRFNKKNTVTAKHGPRHISYDAHTQEEGFAIHEGLPSRSPVQPSEAMKGGLADLNRQDEHGLIESNLEQLRQLDKPKPQSKLERNVVDPTFSFSDEETLLPKRTKTSQLEPTKHASLPLPSLLDPTAQRDPIQRRPRARPRAASRNSLPNIASHNQARNDGQHSTGKSITNQIYSNSDGERLLPSRKRRDIRNLNLVPHAEKSPILNDIALSDSASKERPVIASQIDESFAKPKKQRRRSSRISSLPDSIVKTKETQGKALVSSIGREELPSAHADGDVDLDSLNSPQKGQEIVLPAEETATAILKSPVQRTARLKTDRSELDEDQSPAEPQPVQPATPSRPRTQQGEKKTPYFSNSIMSLLSDADDEEDELSFNLSDFTPSGHHRILTHRPFPELITTPQFSASSTPKKRPSLLQSRSHSSSSHRVLKPPRTPHSAGVDRVGNTSDKRKHRKSHQLASSVVRVVRRLDSEDGREGSVVQTPGGSRRRCGEKGWKCERDFCFVCME